MGLNYALKQKFADSMIRRYGAQLALRRRDANDNIVADYTCFGVIMQFDPMERVGKPLNLLDRKVILSPIGLTTSPNFRTDSIVTYKAGITPLTVDEELKIIEPAGRISPAGVVVYWELVCREAGT